MVSVTVLHILEVILSSDFFTYNQELDVIAGQKMNLPVGNSDIRQNLSLTITEPHPNPSSLFAPPTLVLPSSSRNEGVGVCGYFSAGLSYGSVCRTSLPCGSSPSQCYSCSRSSYACCSHSHSILVLRFSYPPFFLAPDGHVHFHTPSHSLVFFIHSILSRYLLFPNSSYSFSPHTVHRSRPVSELSSTPPSSFSRRYTKNSHRPTRRYISHPIPLFRVDIFSAVPRGNGARKTKNGRGKQSVGWV